MCSRNSCSRVGLQKMSCPRGRSPISRNSASRSATTGRCCNNCFGIISRADSKSASRNSVCRTRTPIFAMGGRELSARCGHCPYAAAAAAAWQITLRKIENGGGKISGRRDQFTLARELLADSDVKPLIPAWSASNPRHHASKECGRQIVGKFLGEVVPRVQGLLKEVS